MLHIWHEDSANSSTNQFWKFLCQNNVSPKLADADIRSFDGNKNLADYLKKGTLNANDVYIILADYVPDNSKALKYYLDIKSTSQKYKNVYVANLLSFEYMILRFKYFETWTKPQKAIRGYEALRPIRAEMIKLVDSGTAWVNSSIIVNYVVNHYNIDTKKMGWQAELAFISSENIVTWILSQMTNGGTTQFGINKTTFGKCWHSNCCVLYPNNLIGKKKCRLYKYGKTSQEKAKNLWNGTLAKKIVCDV